MGLVGKGVRDDDYKVSPNQRPRPKPEAIIFFNIRERCVFLYIPENKSKLMVAHKGSMMILDLPSTFPTR